MDLTQRLRLPLLAPGQGQKEIFHNEALVALDTIVAAAVEEPERNAPPASPSAGTTYIVGLDPGGAWTGHSLELATFSPAGWRFFTPTVGMNIWIKSVSLPARWSGTTWEIGVTRASEILIDGVKVVGAQASSVASPAGGATIDTEARAALDAVLNALRGHGLIAS